MNYIVQHGDTIFYISRRFGITMAAVMLANPQLTSADDIFVGQIIRIPTMMPPIPPPGAGRYVVQPGDTLIVIANRFNTTLSALLAANRQISNPDLIYPGQIIFIP